MEDYGNFFFHDLGLETLRLARNMGFTVTFNASLCRPDAALCGVAGTRIDETTLVAHLDAAIQTRPDVLVLVLRGPEFTIAIDRLKAARPWANDTAAVRVADGAHVLSGLWWQGTNWVGPQGGECLDMAGECAFVMGAQCTLILSPLLSLTLLPSSSCYPSPSPSQVLGRWGLKRVPHTAMRSCS